MSKFSVRRPVTVIMICLGLLVLGMISIEKINLRLLPPIVSPEFSIVTKFKGATPLEVEEKIIKPIEDAVSTSSGLYRTESYAEMGRGVINLKFTSEVDIVKTISTVRDSIESIGFPDGASRPKILRFNPNALPVMRVAFSPNKGVAMGMVELGRTLSEDLVKKIESLKGVATVVLRGRPQEEILIRVDPLKSTFYGIDISSLAQTIKSRNRNLPGGRITKDGKMMSIRLFQKLDSLESLANLSVLNSKSGDIKLKDVAKIERIYRPPSVLTRLSGRDSLILEVKKESEANTVILADGVREILSQFKDQNTDVMAMTLIDQGKDIKSSIDSVVDAVISGGILAALVIYLFLQSVGPTFIVTLSIPMSIMITMTLMYFTGVSFNLMSLGGLALGVGMLVDNSIVVLENISTMKSQTDDSKQAVIWGSEKVAGAITMSTLTTIAVFLPLIFVEGIIGQLFRDISLTVVYSLGSSLFVALILIPCLSAWDLKSPETELKMTPLLDYAQKEGQLLAEKLVGGPLWAYPYTFFSFCLKAAFVFLLLMAMFITQSFGWLLSRPLILIRLVFGRVAAPILGKVEKFLWWVKDEYVEVLSHWYPKRGMVLTSIFLLFVGSIGALGFKGAELFPADQVDRFQYTLEFPSGQTINYTERFVMDIEKDMLKMDGVRNVASFVGGDGEHTANLMVMLEPTKDAPVTLVEQKLGKILAGVPSLKFSKMEEGFLGSSKPLEMEVYSDNLDHLRQVGDTLQDQLSQVDGIKDVETSLKGDISEINIRFDQARLARSRMDLGSYSGVIQSLILGKSANNLFLEGDKIPIRLRGMDSSFDKLDKLRYFGVKNSNKIVIPLNSVADIETNRIMSRIKRIDRKRALTVSAAPQGVELDEAAQMMQSMIGKTATHKNMRWQVGGQDIERKKSQESLLFAVGLSIFLIYLILASQFESFRQPLIVLIAVPLCLVGVALALYVINMSISALVMIGLIILAGISVNTSIVLVDTINQKLMDGMKMTQAIFEASANRIRPILMSALSTIIGLLPMAVGLGQGAAMRQPLAVSVIGGLVSSTVLTLLVVPFIYARISGHKPEAT